MQRWGLARFQTEWLTHAKAWRWQWRLSAGGLKEVQSQSRTSFLLPHRLWPSTEPHPRNIPLHLSRSENLLTFSSWSTKVVLERLLGAGSRVTAAPCRGRFVPPLWISSRPWGITCPGLSAVAWPTAAAEGKVVQKGVDVRPALPWCVWITNQRWNAANRIALGTSGHRFFKDEELKGIKHHFKVFRSRWCYN